MQGLPSTPPHTSYPQAGNPEHPELYGKWVRGNEGYGLNDFVDNGDDTVTDADTELMWTQIDSGDEEFADLLSNYTYADGSLKWEEALDFCENLIFAGHDGWRLPYAKELHSIVDYTRSPQATGSAAIDPIFEISSIITGRALQIGPSSGVQPPSYPDTTSSISLSAKDSVS